MCVNLIAQVTRETLRGCVNFLMLMDLSTRRECCTTWTVDFREGIVKFSSVCEEVEEILEFVIADVTCVAKN